MGEKLSIPERSPDLVTPWGWCFWWVEMIFMNRDNQLFVMRVDGEEDKRSILLVRSTDDFVDRGLTNHEWVIKQYDEWQAQFDNIVLGANSD